MARGLFLVIIFSFSIQLIMWWAIPAEVGMEPEPDVEVLTSAQHDSIILAAQLAQDSILIEARNNSYTELLSNIAYYRKKLQEQYLAAADSNKTMWLDSADRYLFSQLTRKEGVLDHWMGTRWDFNGISTEPLKGEIACGYYVSTPLMQMGFNLNRYKLAQQYSHAIAKSLCEPGSIQTYNDLEKLIQKLEEKPNQLYIVGLDNHVGFLANIAGSMYFIHSDYMTVKVVKEEARSSPALQASNLYVVGNLLGNNPTLVKKWLQNSTIAIVP